jgi:hypothetical protein
MNADEEMAKTEQQRPQPELGLDWIKSSPRYLSAFICVHLRLKGVVPALGKKRQAGGRGAEFLGQSGKRESTFAKATADRSGKAETGNLNRETREIREKGNQAIGSGL